LKTDDGEYQGEEFPAQLSNYQFAKKHRLIGLFDFTVIFLGKQVGSNET
jgi:hypothetical protein